MKTSILISLIIGALVVSNLSASVAQDSEKARDLFVRKQADGLEVKLANVHGNLLDPSQEFKQGDKIKIDFRSNFDGYIYLVNVTPDKVTKVLGCDEVKADNSYLLPKRGYMEFDEVTGTEILRIVLSRTRIKTYDNALKKPGGVLSEAATIPNNPSSEPVGIVATPCAGARSLELASGQKAGCRGLVLASGNPAKNEGSVVAIADQQGTKLSEGQIALFELRLKHVGSSMKSPLSQNAKGR